LQAVIKVSAFVPVSPNPAHLEQLSSEVETACRETFRAVSRRRISASLDAGSR
jgi:hypothetical protein